MSARARCIVARNAQVTDGAGSRDRTRDPVITNHVLYQLSYASDGPGHTRSATIAATTQAARFTPMVTLEILSIIIALKFMAKFG